MPGRILIIDPIVTNRIMLKSQLSAQFFAVDLAEDFESCRPAFQRAMPDAVVLNYRVEEATDFTTCRRLKSSSRTAHIPVFLLCQAVEDTFWQTAYHLEVEEVLPITPDAEMLSCRLAQLIRSKDALEAERRRQMTYHDLGFSEPAIGFPPQFPSAVRIGIETGSLSVLKPLENAIGTLLKGDFPNVTFVDPETQESDLLLVGGPDGGLETALSCLSREDRKSRTGTSRQKILFLSPDATPDIYRRSLELGADDCTQGTAGAAELACRLRALAWRQQTERRAAKSVNDRLQLAMRDPLTGAFNRRYAEQYLDRLLHTGSSSEDTVTVMMLDIDNFKKVNDSFGHSAGDAVITETIRRLSANLRSSDLIARIGGEEFLVILQDTPQKQALSIAERMRRKINLRQFRVDGLSEPLNVTISIGVTYALRAGSSRSILLKRADEALYFAKETGRDRVTFLKAAA